MDKRRFLVTSGLASLLPAGAALAATADARASNPLQPGLLTVTGAVGKSNRGPFDPVLDLMMHRHGIQFDKAFVLDAGALQGLPSVTIKPTLEYDSKPHQLEGPLLSSVLDAAGAPRGNTVQLGLRAVDGYNVTLSLSDAAAYRMIVAIRIDGKPMALGGLGPQWAVYDADSLAAFKDKPVNQRFALCPWGLYHIDVKA
ncbi:MAG: molybdopterin-dependent oxidoreductase [Burkholderiaceae bacterium]